MNRPSNKIKTVLPGSAAIDKAQASGLHKRIVREQSRGIFTKNACQLGTISSTHLRCWQRSGSEKAARLAGLLSEVANVTLLHCPTVLIKMLALPESRHSRIWDVCGLISFVKIKGLLFVKHKL